MRQARRGVIIMEKQDILKKDDPREMLQDIEAVIFDLDGSLVDSMWLWKAIDVEYLGQIGRAHV